MSSELRLRRGTNTEHTSFTGADSEATVNTTNKSIHVHDGTTAGGFELARADLNNVSNVVFAAKATAAGVSGGSGLTATISAATKASPVVITTTSSHNFIDAQQVTINSVGGMTQINGITFYADVLTANTFGLYTDAGLTTPVNGTAYTTYTSGGTATGGVSAGAPISGSYVTINAEGGLPNERRLQASNGIIITDGGAGGAVTVAANLAATAPSNLGSASAGVATTVARADHIHAMPTASDVGAVPTSRQVLGGTGLSGGGALTTNLTLSLNANLNNLTDVTITGTPANGDVLMYNDATSQFENSSTFAKNSILLNNASVATNTINKFNFIGTGLTAAVNGSDSSRIDITVASSNTADVQAIVGAMVSSNTESGIDVTYNAVSGKLNFDVADPVITLSGDVTGSATMTNLGNVTITTTVAANSVALGTDTTGNYVATVAANATAGYGGITITGSGAETAAVIIGIDPANADFKESIEDIVGGMVTTNTEAGIVVTYDDTAGKLNFDVNDPIITLSGAITGSATIANLTNTTITTSIAADAVTLGTNTTGNYVAGITGANGISVSGSGVESATVTLSIDGTNATFKETVEDLASNLLTVSTHLGLTATYDDANNKITLDVNDPVITLAGAVAGSATMTNLTNTTITVTQQNDSVTLGTHTTGNYVATIAGANGISVSGSGAETAAVTLSINPLNTDFIEIIQDIVGGMVSDTNVEAGISVTYDDANARLNFDVADPTITLSGVVTGSGTMANLSSLSITTSISNDAVTLGTHTTGNYVATITGANGVAVTGSGTETAAITLSIDTTNAVFKEGIEDIVGTMISPTNIENGIVVTYDDANAKINFDVNDPVITLSGDVTGSATMTNLGDVTISATIAANSVALGTDTTGNYVATIAAGNGIAVTGSGVESAAITISVNPAEPNFVESIQDIVGTMISDPNTENGIVVTYDDANAKINFDVNDPVITLSGDITGSATMTNLGSVTIAATIAANSVELGTDTTGNYVATITGANGIVVTGSGAENAAIALTLDKTNSEFRNTIQDVAALMFSTGNGLTITYNDTTNAISIDPNDPLITIAGAVTGSATMTNLANTTITVAQANDSVTLGTHTTGNYIATITGANGIVVTGSGVETADITLDFDSQNAVFVESVQDIIGAMVTGNSETGIAVVYDDAGAKLNFNVNDPTITLDGDVSGSAQMVDLGSITITTTVADNSHNHTIANITGLQTALDAKISALNTSFTGTTTVETLVPAGNVAYDLGSSTARFNSFYATTLYGNATRALYADLAERYHADANYPIGSVVKLGGSKEITATTTENDAQVIGVISENPAYLMNDGAGDPKEWLPVAMTGRVRVKIVGPVTKGQRIVSSNETGVAKAINDNDIVSFTTVIGRALRSSDDSNIKLVECIIGKF